MKKIIFSENSLNNIINNLELLVEVSKLEFLVNKYLNTKNPKLNWEVLKNIIFIDPTTTPVPEDIENLTIDDMQGYRIGKYVSWLIKMYLTPGEDISNLDEYRHLFFEDSLRIKQILDKYDRFKNLAANPIKKDISKIESIDELYTLPIKISSSGEVVPLEMYVGSKKKGAITNLDNNLRDKFIYPGSSIEFEGQEYTVIKITSKSEAGQKAASYFGGYHLGVSLGETVWCTSPEKSYNFNSYINRGPLYIILPNNATTLGQKTGLPATRYQIGFNSSTTLELKDSNNSNVDGKIFGELFIEGGRFEELREYFSKELADFFGKKITKNFEFKATNSSSIFENLILLAGLDNVFENYLSDIEVLSIYGNKNLKLSKDFIGKYFIKFKDSLEFLKLENTITELPDIFNDFINLSIVNVSNNSNLSKLPESLLANENVAIILHDNTGVNYSDEYLEHFGKKNSKHKANTISAF
jgi:hypothetical protein